MEPSERIWAPSPGEEAAITKDPGDGHVDDHNSAKIRAEKQPEIATSPTEATEALKKKMADIWYKEKLAMGINLARARLTVAELSEEASEWQWDRTGPPNPIGAIMK
jgi:hypothetical protein